MSYIATLILYPLLTTALFYLGAYATITAPIHTRYPSWLASFMSCPACSGTWYGALVAGVLGYTLNLPFLGLPGNRYYTVIIAAGCAMVWTPLLFSVLIGALRSIQADNDWFAGNTPNQKLEALIPEMAKMFQAYTGGPAAGTVCEAESGVSPPKVVPFTTNTGCCTYDTHIAGTCPLHFPPPKAG